MNQPFIIGLTGSIGMGKTTTAEMFRAHDIPVWSADDAVHRLYRKDGAAVPLIAKLCPEAETPNGIDRVALSKWIAHTPGALARVEAIVHPLVAEDRREFLSSVDSDIVLLDIPLLFETDGEGMVDAVVVVTAPGDVQRQRVMAREGMTDEKFRMILAKQMPDEEKRERADYIVQTTGLEAAESQVQKIIEDIRSGLADARDRT